MVDIVISIPNQTLTLSHGTGKDISYPVSTAEKGVGQIKGSYQTPIGQHYIRAMIGRGAPLHAVFVRRRLTGEIYTSNLAAQYPTRDWILSRILWLCGVEPGLNRLGNCDTMQRYIYIHGTPETEPIGVPKSHGCIRMRNHDIVSLFQQVTVGTPVFIGAV
jgi:lipoprotein-anchoring transpeptidase ErfK/SrfK